MNTRVQAESSDVVLSLIMILKSRYGKDLRQRGHCGIRNPLHMPERWMNWKLSI